MWFSLADHVRKFTGTAGVGASAARHLRGRVWLSRALTLTGLTPKEFGNEYVYRGRRGSGLVYRWLNGQVSPSRQSVAMIDRHLPGSLEFYNLPLFELLEDRPMSRQRVEALLQPYRSPSGCLNPWRFPNDRELVERKVYVGTLARWDCDTLYRRGDFWGFQAIVGLVRLAEAIGHQNYHVMCAQEMFRAVPSVLRELWFNDHFDLLYACLEAIRWRYLFTGQTFDVDVDMLKSQAADPAHQPNPLVQLSQHPGRPPVQPSDPIWMAKIIRGAELQRHCTSGTEKPM